MKGGMEVAGVYTTLLPWGSRVPILAGKEDKCQQLEGLCSAVRSTLGCDVQTLLLTRWVGDFRQITSPLWPQFLYL